LVALLSLLRQQRKKLASQELGFLAAEKLSKFVGLTFAGMMDQKPCFLYFW
jgi:hypothetical protein